MQLICISGQGALKAGKGFTLLISNIDNDDIIKIVELQEKSGLFINGATATIKHKINRKKVDFLGL